MFDLFCYDTTGDCQVSILNGNLVVRFRDYVTLEPFYSFLGCNRMAETVERLMALSREQGGLPSLRLVPESCIGGALDDLDGGLVIAEDPDSADYIIDAPSLTALSSGRWRNKRNVASKFKRNHWLILSHGFNMDGRAASLTITDKIPYLLEAGIKVTVISAITGKRDKRFLHLQLLPWGPSGLRFDLRHLLLKYMGRGFLYRLIILSVSFLLAPFIILENVLFGLQNQASWALPVTIRSLFIIFRDRPTLVYSTGGAYSAHLAGYWLKKITGIKWIAEIHDPMVLTVKNRNDRFVAKLEGCICRYADLVWWFTTGALESARRRHPELGDRGIVVIPGSSSCHTTDTYQHQENKMEIGYFGTLSDSRSLLPVVPVIGKLIDSYPEVRSKISVNVYGGSIDSAAQEEISRLGLGDVFKCCGRLEQTPEDSRSSREQAAALMVQSDCLLLLHGCFEACSEYIPLKLYEYLWAKRPIIALTYQNKELDRLLAERKCYIAATDKPEEIFACLKQAYSDWESNTLPQTELPPIGVDQAVETIFKELRRPRKVSLASM